MKQGLYSLIVGAALGALLFGITPAISSAPHPVRQLTGSGTLIAAGTTLAATRSISITNNDQGNQAYGLAMLYACVTDADDGEVGVSLTCTGQRPGATYGYRIPACPWDSDNTRYNCEGGPLFWNPSDDTEVATNVKCQVFRVDIEGLVQADCSFAFTTGSASDTIQVDVDLATKG